MSEWTHEAFLLISSQLNSKRYLVSVSPRFEWLRAIVSEAANQNRDEPAGGGYTLLSFVLVSALDPTIRVFAIPVSGLDVGPARL